jgi:hypothetical protein
MVTPDLVDRCWALFANMNTVTGGVGKRKRKGLRLHQEHANFMGLQLPAAEQGHEWYQQMEAADGGCLFWSLAASVTKYTNDVYRCKDVETGTKIRALIYGVIRELSRDASSPRWRALWRERVSYTLRKNTRAKDSSVVGLLAAAKEMNTTGAYADMLHESVQLDQAYPFGELHSQWMRWVDISSWALDSWGDSRVEALLLAAALQRDVIVYMRREGRWESIGAWPGGSRWVCRIQTLSVCCSTSNSCWSTDGPQWCQGTTMMSWPSAPCVLAELRRDGTVGAAERTVVLERVREMKLGNIECSCLRRQGCCADRPANARSLLSSDSTCMACHPIMNLPTRVLGHHLYGLPS